MDGGAWWADFHFSLLCIGEGNGNPLQCSCLENPRHVEPSGLPSMGCTESDTTEGIWRQQHSRKSSMAESVVKVLEVSGGKLIYYVAILGA